MQLSNMVKAKNLINDAQKRIEQLFGDAIAAKSPLFWSDYKMLQCPLFPLIDEIEKGRVDPETIDAAEREIDELIADYRRELPA